MEEKRRILLATVRESFGRVVHSHKTHEKCADLLLTRQHQLRLAQIILSAITTAGYVSAVLGSKRPTAAIIGISLSTLLLVLNAYTKDYDLGKIAQQHRQAGSDLWLIREHYECLMADIKMEHQSIDELLKRRDTLIQQLHEVYHGAPSTTYKAYKQAQEALQKLEDMTFSDDEIDKFLPKELKSNHKS
jgi:HPt (histidine-containing phosphotransfer) domain-containing protein